MKTKLRLMREIISAYRNGFIFGWDSSSENITLHLDPSIQSEVAERLGAYLGRSFDVASVEHNRRYSQDHRQKYSELVISITQSS